MQAQEVIEQIDVIGDAIPVNDTFNAFFWSFMAFNLIVIALTRTLNPGYIRILFNTAIHNRQLVNNIREDLDLGRFTSVLLNFTYFSSLSVIIWMAIKSDANDYLLFIAIALFAGAGIKLLVIRTIAFLANSKTGLQEHLLNHLIYFQIGGFILTPILIFTHYVPELYVNYVLIILIIIVSLFIVVREFQSFTRAIQYKMSVFYIILYLCTLELLPLIVGIRVFILNSEVLN